MKDWIKTVIGNLFTLKVSSEEEELLSRKEEFIQYAQDLQEAKIRQAFVEEGFSPEVFGLDEDEEELEAKLKELERIEKMNLFVADNE